MNILSAIWGRVAVGIAAGLLLVAHSLSPTPDTRAVISPSPQISTSTEQVAQSTSSPIQPVAHVQTQIARKVSKPTCEISVTPDTISQGGSALLLWSSTNATAASITWITSVVDTNDTVIGTSGSETVSPGITKTYLGTFTGANNSTAQCSTTLTVLQNATTPQAATAPVSSSATQATNPASTTDQGMSPAQFVQMLYTAESAAIQNDPLVTEKIILDKLLNADYQITPSEFASLTPDIQQLIQQYPKQPSIILLQIEALNQQIAAYNFKIESQFQTQINTYSAENGLPITQPVPTETNCTLSSTQTSGNAQCYTY